VTTTEPLQLETSPEISHVPETRHSTFEAITFTGIEPKKPPPTLSTPQPEVVTKNTVNAPPPKKQSSHAFDWSKSNYEDLFSDVKEPPPQQPQQSQPPQQQDEWGSFESVTNNTSNDWGDFTSASNFQEPATFVPNVVPPVETKPYIAPQPFNPFLTVAPTTPAPVFPTFEVTSPLNNFIIFSLNNLWPLLPIRSQKNFPRPLFMYPPQLSAVSLLLLLHLQSHIQLNHCLYLTTPLNLQTNTIYPSTSLNRALLCHLL
jgi:hypothetical protein